MLKDLVIHSINHFQKDCLKLCKYNYPTVHNGGMSQHHLGRAFVRRLTSCMNSLNLFNQFEPMDTVLNPKLPHHYRVTSDKGTVWVITHHFVTANSACKKKWFAYISEWQAEYSFAIQPNDLLVLLGDHWITKAKYSRELLDWWLEELPNNYSDYVEQGVHLYKSQSKLVHELDARFQVRPCYLQFAHPLIRTRDQRLVRKYIQLYAILEWQK